VVLPNVLPLSEEDFNHLFINQLQALQLKVFLGRPFSIFCIESKQIFQSTALTLANQASIFLYTWRTWLFPASSFGE
jgi:hypothetical protein